MPCTENAGIFGKTVGKSILETLRFLFCLVAGKLTNVGMRLKSSLKLTVQLELYSEITKVGFYSSLFVCLLACLLA